MFEDRIEAVRTLINEHNAAIGDGNPGQVKADELINFIKASGGTSEERLKSFSHEDILDCMTSEVVTGPIKPKILAKNIASLFRAKEQQVEERAPISAKKAEKMTLQDIESTFKLLTEINQGWIWWS